MSHMSTLGVFGMVMDMKVLIYSVLDLRLLQLLLRVSCTI